MRPANDDFPMALTGASSLHDLAGAARFVLWSLRAGARGGAWDQPLALEFRRQFGPLQASAAQHRFQLFLAAFAAALRRPLRFHHPCCPCLDIDERQALLLLASAQAGLPAEDAGCIFEVPMEAAATARLVAAAEDFAWSLTREDLSLAMSAREGADARSQRIH